MIVSFKTIEITTEKPDPPNHATSDAAPAPAYMLSPPFSCFGANGPTFFEAATPTNATITTTQKTPGQTGMNFGLGVSFQAPRHRWQQ